MTLSLDFKPNKQFSSEITTDNILNYKRRSNLVSKIYNYETNKTTINSTQTLKNCYDALYDMKNVISDYISTRRKNLSLYNIEINKIIEKYKTEILSAFNILNNYNNNKNKVKNKEENKILKNITNILQVLQLLYLDL
jgi:hypothetical protein